MAERGGMRRLRAAMLACCLACAVGLAAAAGPHPSLPVVEVPGLGLLMGSSGPEAPSVAKFRRVPYAKAPVGDLRWRSPQPHGPWESEGILNATIPPPSCYGARPRTALDTDGEAIQDMSENCLFLNIYMPVEALGKAAELPVLVWFHGGSFLSGSPNDYPGEMLVEQSKGSAIVVTVGYRLHVFGFLGSRDLIGRGTGAFMPSFGIQDQRLALEWVQANIQAFGGSGSKVTIFGEGAGGNSVLHHLVETPSFGLYNRAIVESGTYRNTVTSRVAEDNYLAMLMQTRCSDLDCLLALAPEALLDAGDSVAMSGSTWGPIIDNNGPLPAPPSDMIQSGHYNTMVPVLVGANRDDMAYFMFWNKEVFPPSMGESQLDSILSSFLSPSDLSQAKAIYTAEGGGYGEGAEHLSGYSKEWVTLMRIFTDRTCGVCEARRLARGLVEHGSPAAFFYFFDSPGAGGVRGSSVGGAGFATHMGELPKVEQQRLEGEELKEAQALEVEVAEYWLQFALFGNPNTVALPRWEPYSDSTDTDLRFALPSAGGIFSERGLRRSRCDFWEQQRVRQRSLGLRGAGGGGRWDDLWEQSERLLLADRSQRATAVSSTRSMFSHRLAAWVQLPVFAGAGLMVVGIVVFSAMRWLPTGSHPAEAKETTDSLLKNGEDSDAKAGTLAPAVAGGSWFCTAQASECSSLRSMTASPSTGSSPAPSSSPSPSPSPSPPPRSRNSAAGGMPLRSLVFSNCCLAPGQGLAPPPPVSPTVSGTAARLSAAPPPPQPSSTAG